MCEKIKCTEALSICSYDLSWARHKTVSPLSDNLFILWKVYKDMVKQCPRGYRYDSVLDNCVIDFSQGLQGPYRAFDKAVEERGKRLATVKQHQRINVCSYLKKKIADEEKESRQYQQLETDLRALTNGHAYLDVLLEAQHQEVRQLIEAYRNYCKPGQV